MEITIIIAPETLADLAIQTAHQKTLAVNIGAGAKVPGTVQRRIHAPGRTTSIHLKIIDIYPRLT